jgi:O-succinylbenzoate synthase
VLRVRVPLVRPHRAAHGVESEREVVLVEWTDRDGEVGWGECPTLSHPGYVIGTTDEAWRTLVGELGPSVASGSWSADGVYDTDRGARTAAVAALRDARLDAGLRRRGVSLSEHLGATRATVRRCVVLADLGGDPGALALRAAAARDGGASMVKVKIAPGHDAEVITAVRAAVGDLPVAADANGSYRDPGQLAEVDRCGLAYLEQPFGAAAEWDELASAHRLLRTPIALDESLGSPDATRRAIEAGAVDVVSVKPSRLGGIDAAAGVVRLAAAAGLPVFIGGMLELAIGRAGAAALAAMSGCSLPTDLGPSDAYVAPDLADPLVLDDRGRLVVPDGAGLGRRPDPARLRDATVDEVVFDR